MSVVQNWLRFADEDVKMAELAMREGLYNQVCFHSQQAVEKALKALLSHSGRVSPRTHKLIDILSSLGEKTPFEDLEEPISILDSTSQPAIPMLFLALCRMDFRIRRMQKKLSI